MNRRTETSRTGPDSARHCRSTSAQSADGLLCAAPLEPSENASTGRCAPARTATDLQRRTTRSDGGNYPPHPQQLGLSLGHWTFDRLMHYAHEQLAIPISRSQLGVNLHARIACQIFRIMPRHGPRPAQITFNHLLQRGFCGASLPYPDCQPRLAAPADGPLASPHSGRAPPYPRHPPWRLAASRNCARSVSASP